MDELFKGGPKQQQLNGMSNSMNPLKNMVDNVVMSNSQMREKLENYQGSTTYNDFMMEKSYNQTNQMDQHSLYNNNLDIQNFMQFNNNKQLINQDNLNINYDNINKNTNIHRSYNNQNYYPTQQLGLGGSSMIHPMIQKFNSSIQESTEKQIIKDKEDQIDDDELKNITKDIIDTMSNNNQDERFKNSEFLKFMQKLHDKELVIDEKSNSVAQNKDFKPVNDIMGKDKTKEEDDINKMFEKVMSEVNQNFDNEQDIYKYIQEQNKAETIFETDNPYLNEKEYETIDLVELAKKLLSEGKSQEAKLVLEAESQRNGDNTEAWTMLGRIHSENDCDNYAFQCLLRALDVDPFNLDAELALGILCTNEFDELDAMIHLKNWIRLHPIYSKFLDENNPVLDEKIIKEAEKVDVEGEDVYLKAKRIDKMRNNFYNEMINLMENIYNQNQNDSDLLISMGIAHFIPSKNERSIQCFRKAVEVNPKDYNAWNKLGAVFAHSKHQEEALNCYKRALELKPDYVRCWANHGIAHYNLNNYDEGARSYIKALSICPEINHIWSYLRSLLIVSGKNDLLKLVEMKNIDELCKIYKIK